MTESNASQNVLDFLLRAAHTAPSADNSQPWRLTVDGDVLRVSYDAARVAGNTFPVGDPATGMAFGALYENLDQAAAAAGMTLEPVENDDEAVFGLRLRGLAQASVPGQSPALFVRHTNRFPYRVDALPADLNGWLSAQGEGQAAVTAFTDASAVASIAGLVRDSSRLRFQTREIHELLGKSLRFDAQAAKAGDGLDVATFHLPPGGRLSLRIISEWSRMKLLNRLGAYKMFAAIESQAFGNAAAVVAIVGSDGQQGAIDAGRLMQRVWIELNRRGLAVHPYYVVADQLFRRARGILPSGLESLGERIADDAARILRLRDRSLYMLLRIGYPTNDPVRSRRLPIDRVVAKR